MTANSLKRRLITILLLAAALMSLLAVPGRAASGEVFSDDIWENGHYSSTLGDMSGRRLYVYGIVDSSAEVKTDKDIDLRSEESAGRLDAAQMLYRAFGEKTEELCPFADVPEEYREAVNWLYTAGITKGISEDRYGVGSLSHYHFLIMLSRLLEWGTEDEKDLLSRADSLGLIPADESGNVFSLGDVYQVLCALLDKCFPERCTAARQEMSIPDNISFSANSYNSAVNKIMAAVRCLPKSITLDFAPDCPQKDIDTFLLHFDWINGDKKLPIIGVVNQLFIGSCNLQKLSDRSFRLHIINYASGYKAYIDASGWLKVFADESYRQSLRAFAERYITPLTKLTSPYEQAEKAHDLLCRLASYDYEYLRKAERKEPVRWEAHDMMGFLENGKVLCDGYAEVYQWMLICCGIESYIVTGKADSALHAWNRVCIDGRWYNTDVCWDDTGGVLRKYYMRTDAWFSAHDHIFTDKYSTTAFPSV